MYDMYIHLCWESLWFYASCSKHTYCYGIVGVSIVYVCHLANVMSTALSYAIEALKVSSLQLRSVG